MYHSCVVVRTYTHCLGFAVSCGPHLKATVTKSNQDQVLEVLIVRYVKKYLVGSKKVNFRFSLKIIILENMDIKNKMSNPPIITTIRTV